jgi:hypothetical protein
MTNSLSVGRRIPKSGLSVRLDLYTPYCEWDIGAEFLNEIGTKADGFWTGIYRKTGQERQNDRERNGDRQIVILFSYGRDGLRKPASWQICNELHKSSISFSQVGISFQILSCRGERLMLTH